MDILEQAQRAQARYHREVDEARADTNLSNEGKQRKMAKALRQVETTMERLKRERTDELESTRKRLELRAFQPKHSPGASPEARIAVDSSFRDAVERAERLESVSEALQMVGRAERTGDELLARATAVVAMEKGWGPVLGAFTEAFPAAKGALEELDAFLGQRSPKARLVESMHFSISAPTELRQLGHGQVSELAQQAGDDGGASEFNTAVRSAAGYGNG